MSDDAAKLEICYNCGQEIVEADAGPSIGLYHYHKATNSSWCVQFNGRLVATPSKPLDIQREDDADRRDHEWRNLYAAAVRRAKAAEKALERIAQYDLTQERSGVNVAVLQGIARDALYGPD